MDKVVLKGMVFHAYHGVLPEERRHGQDFEVDVEMIVDLTRPGRTDDINDTIDYAVVYEQVREIVVDRQYRLLESLAEALADRILSNQLVEKVVLRVKKLQPPIAGSIRWAAVEVSRER